ncbi:TRAP transporter substrate-binding protein DctP [Siccirubricoccus sp. G192]|uniref:TRAP transporter substrate-binding protein DctP n=1 Tax=Siccirubricoccus sp. G192 TaxID=2849651 RepID=UPI001C2C3F05|nr:TRAP transporter substrate-binding protein DctP [Siccirubricoccus sp. G192]MBV1798804.1 TRAP transporter substrate-binding protein DctP [Siccirubricoccus sp. G192]
MNTAITRRSAVLAGLVAPLAAPVVARAQAGYRAEYKLSVVGNRPIPFAEGAFIWADLITQRSGGRIQVKVYPGSQLVGGDQTRELLAMRQGVIDFAVLSTINISPQVREASLFQLPFLMPDHRAFDAVIRGEPGRDIFSVIERREVVPLAWGENGFREISNSKRAIRAPSDLRGMKIRFAAGNIFKDIYEALGANPVQMSFADLQPALSTGAVDGQENPINLFLAFRMDTLAQKHLTIWNYVNDPLVFALSKQVWNSFSAADQQLVRECAEEAGRQQIALTRKGLGMEDADRSSLEELARRGVETTVLSAAEKRAFAQATRPVYQKWAGTVGADLVRKAEAAVSAVS